MNWVWMIVGGGLFIGLTNLALKMASVKGVGLLPIGVYFLVVGVGLCAYALWRQPEALGLNFAAPSGLHYALLGALVGVISNVLLFTALGGGAPVGVGFTIFNVVSLLTTVAVGAWMLHEPLGWMQGMGIVLALTSLGLLTWQS
jgi:multidrug transporter EmrE-like cation transporter